MQRKTKTAWVTVANGNDWDTDYNWKRYGLAVSFITIHWRIPSNQSAGIYRIVHDGDVKSVSGKISGYQGVSNLFDIK